jgi:hypothetical protein
VKICPTVVERRAMSLPKYRGRGIRHFRSFFGRPTRPIAAQIIVRSVVELSPAVYGMCGDRGVAPLGLSLRAVPLYPGIWPHSIWVVPATPAARPGRLLPDTGNPIVGAMRIWHNARDNEIPTDSPAVKRQRVVPAGPLVTWGSETMALTSREAAPVDDQDNGRNASALLAQNTRAELTSE